MAMLTQKGRTINITPKNTATTTNKVNPTTPIAPTSSSWAGISSGASGISLPSTPKTPIATQSSPLSTVTSGNLTTAPLTPKQHVSDINKAWQNIDPETLQPYETASKPVSSWINTPTTPQAPVITPTPTVAPAITNENAWKPWYSSTWEYDMQGNLLAKQAADTVEQFNKDKTYLQSQQNIKNQQQAEATKVEWIQSSQRIQQAQQQLDNLKQQTAYLGSQGMPWVSSQHIDAVQKQITQAETTYSQLKEMEAASNKMKELWVQFDSAAFEKQMGDLQDQLNSQVSVAVQDKINQLNALDADGKIDSMEQLDQVRGTMMQELDKSIANIAISNTANRQLILDHYNDVIKQTAEINKNKSIVNKDMSEALWHYVDWNWSPILGANGTPIPVPKEAPFPPQLDKDTGMLITFSQWANWEIIANPQKIYDVPWKQNPRQKWEDGTFYRTNEKWDIEFANAPWTTTTGWVWATGGGYTGKAIPAVSIDTINSKLKNFATSVKPWQKYWQCGKFVNDYTESLGLGRMFIDPIDIRKTQTNSNTPTIGSIAVFDYGNNPNVSQAAQKYWHVAIVTWINNDWTIRIMESNGKSDETVGERVIPANKAYWYFDPAKGLQPINKFDQTDVAVFNNMTPSDRKKAQNDPLYNEFIDKKTKVMKDKEANINDILSYSMWWKTINQTQEWQLSKFWQVLSQLPDIQKLISKQKTWPVIGKLKSMNPYDTDAQILKAQLNSLIPNLARWVYGEVWVLTDADVRQYAKTIPNLESTEDVNKWVLAMTLKTIANGYKAKLQNMAAWWFDVSGYSGIYDDLQSQISDLNSQIWVWKSSNTQNTNVNFEQNRAKLKSMFWL